MSSSNEITYCLIFDTNALFQAYEKKADFTTFSFNSTFENVIDMINQLDIYNQVTVAIPSVVWNEMEKQIIEKHDELLSTYKSMISKKRFPEYSIQENPDINYPEYIKNKLTEYKKEISVGLNKVNIVFKRNSDTDLKKLYEDIIDLRMEVSYPFLLKIHHDCTEELITSDELKEILKLCISYVLRRAICEIPTNSMNKTFATLKNYIKPDDYLNSVKAFFVMQDTYKEFPDNDKFEGAFVNRDIYNMRARNYILSRLENFENKAPITIENYTIEHIMPQNKNLSLEWQTDLGPEWQEVQKKYLHTIGNLTLTAYNSEMSDRPFLNKMDMPGGFKESALRLNKYVVLQNEWNEKHIQERANELVKKAEAIWPYPTLTAAELAPYQAEEKTVQKYSLESYDVNAFTRMLFESLDKRIMNLSPAVKKEYKKLYVAYKLDTNFVDIVFQKQRLRISINMKFSEINDPNGICKDITGLDRWGNGDVELFMEHQDELDQIMEIVKQSYDAQAE